MDHKSAETLAKKARQQDLTPADFEKTVREAVFGKNQDRLNDSNHSSTTKEDLHAQVEAINSGGLVQQFRYLIESREMNPPELLSIIGQHKN